MLASTPSRLALIYCVIINLWSKCCKEDLNVRQNIAHFFNAEFHQEIVVEKPTEKAHAPSESVSKPPKQEAKPKHVQVAEKKQKGKLAQIFNIVFKLA